jgi:hypothetical protein
VLVEWSGEEPTATDVDAPLSAAPVELIEPDAALAWQLDSDAQAEPIDLAGPDTVAEDASRLD